MKTAYQKSAYKVVRVYFPDEYVRVLGGIDKRYSELAKDTRFAAASSNPMDKRLDFSAYFLAAILTFEARGVNYDQIRKICLEIVYDYVAPKNVFQKWMKKLPAKFIGGSLARFFLKRLREKLRIKGHPDGFRAELLTDKAQTFNLGYGVNILECGICKLFNKHQAGKYASILCEVDKVTSGLAGLELVRTSTIAYGADICDFKWKRI